jgi:hypothetical protein
VKEYAKQETGCLLPDSFGFLPDLLFGGGSTFLRNIVFKHPAAPVYHLLFVMC